MPFEPPPVGSSAETQKLHAYYKEHGESELLQQLERSLPKHPKPVAEIARSAGVSDKWARKALEHLAVEGRAERTWERTTKKPGKRSTWRYLFSAPRAR